VWYLFDRCYSKEKWEVEAMRMRTKNAIV
jgi:hypothetical protein